MKDYEKSRKNYEQRKTSISQNSKGEINVERTETKKQKLTE